MSTRIVIKRDGTEQFFNEHKINRWAEYAARHDVNWKEIAQETIARLPHKTSSEEIHQTMIKVCLDREALPYSRVAARLLYAQLRKSMALVGLNDKSAFGDILKTFSRLGLWTEVKYHPAMEYQYSILYRERLEYWQIKQWVDKYGLKLNDVCVETPHMGALAIGYSVFPEDPEKAFKLAKAVIKGKINLPTPVANGVRNGSS